MWISYLVFYIEFRKANLDMLDFCAHYYKREMLIELYSGHISPVGHPEDWQVPNSVTSQVVNAPVVRTPSGRPKNKRIPSAGEKRKRRHQVCSTCKQHGHNRVNCNNHVVLDTRTSSTEHSRKRPRRCSLCVQSGHTRQNCPSKSSF